MIMNVDIKRVKIFVTVPVDSVGILRDEICKIGAGVIGEYSYCSTSTKCIGTFIPSSSAKPYIGLNNNLEFVEEEKLEVVCDVSLVSKVLLKIKEVHPYETPAIDIVPLIDEEYFK